MSATTTGGGGGFARFANRKPAPNAAAAAADTTAVAVTAPEIPNNAGTATPWTNAGAGFDPFADFGSAPSTGGAGGEFLDSFVGDSMMGDAWGEDNGLAKASTQGTSNDTGGGGVKPAGLGLALFKNRPGPKTVAEAPMESPAFMSPKPPVFNVQAAVSTSELNGGLGNFPGAMQAGSKTPPPPGSFATAPAMTMTTQTTDNQVSRFSQTTVNAVVTPHRPPLNAALLPAYFASEQVLPVKTPAKPTFADGVMMTEKEHPGTRRVSFAEPETPDEATLPDSSFTMPTDPSVAAMDHDAATAPGKEQDLDSFEDIHQAFLSKTRDFGYKEESYTQDLLEMNLLLSTSHAETLRAQADALDLTERLQAMSSEMDTFVRECLAG